MTLEQRLNNEIQVYRVDQNTTFIPTAKHPTGTLIGDFYIKGKKIGRGRLIPRNGNTQPKFGRV